MKWNTATFAAILIVLPGMGTSFQAAVVYEGFDYAAGTNLNGLNGGTGFSAGWAASSVPEAPFAITATGLDFPGLDPSVRAMNGGQPNDSIQRSLSSPFAGTNGTTTWASYLLRVTSLDSASYATMFLTAAGVFPTPTYGQFGVYSTAEGTYFALGNSFGSTVLSSVAVSLRWRSPQTRPPSSWEASLGTLRGMKPCPSM